MAEVAVVDKLLASYALLTAAEQRTLQVLAVLAQPALLALALQVVAAVGEVAVQVVVKAAQES